MIHLMTCLPYLKYQCKVTHGQERGWDLPKIVETLLFLLIVPAEPPLQVLEPTHSLPVPAKSYRIGLWDTVWKITLR